MNIHRLNTRPIEAADYEAFISSSYDDLVLARKRFALEHHPCGYVIHDLDCGPTASHAWQFNEEMRCFLWISEKAFKAKLRRDRLRPPARLSDIAAFSMEEMEQAMEIVEQVK